MHHNWSGSHDRGFRELLMLRTDSIVKNLRAK
jgi:hypothetical protein